MTIDTATYAQFVLALVFVLALIGILAAIARRLGLGEIHTGKPNQGRRLAVVEVRALDAKRKLVLLRRDGVEHLILIGPANETLIESGIALSHGDFAGALHHAATSATLATESSR
jgi:flagellar protein FliO/FliZ